MIKRNCRCSDDEGWGNGNWKGNAACIEVVGFSLRIIVGSVQIKEMEAIHWKSIFLLGQSVLLAGEDRLFNWNIALIDIPLNLTALVSTVLC